VIAEFAMKVDCVNDSMSAAEETAPPYAARKH